MVNAHQLAPRTCCLTNYSNWVTVNYGNRQSELNLQDCIECSLCDRVCPSEINLAQFFGHGKVIEKQRLAVNAEKLRIQDRFENHQARLQAKEQEGNQRRQQRMNERLQRLQQSRGGDQ